MAQCERERGNIHILDLRSLNLKTGKIAAPIKPTLPAGITFKVTQIATTTFDADRFLVASVNGYNKGLGSLTIMRDAQAAQRLPSCKA